MLNFFPFFLFVGIILLGCSGHDQKRHSKSALSPSEILIKHIADHYPQFSEGKRPPGFGGKLSDFGKYNYPKILAVFSVHGDTVEVWNKQLDIFATKPTFHFNLLGLTRLLYQFPNAPGIQRNEKEFLKRVFERNDSYNPWTAEGTENHVSMSRCSGYLYAQLAAEKYPHDFPEAKEKLMLMKEWVQYFAQKVGAMGTGEWNSSIYGSYNILPWINLYDFASDPEVKSLSKQVLDHYATELAHNYFQGLTGGADMRGKGNFKSFSGSTAYLGWLWFGDSPSPISVESLNRGANNATHLAQNIHAALSSYAPSKEIHALNRATGMFYNSKPDYLLSTASYIKHTHYRAEDFHLGAGYFPYGGWSAGDFQIVPWKLLSRVEPGQNKSVQYVSGIGGQAPNSFFQTGNMRSPFDQLVHHENVLIQMTRIPENAKEIQNEMEGIFEIWSEKWKTDFQKRFPNDAYKLNEEPVNFQKIDLSKNASYLVFHPNGGFWKQHIFGDFLILELEKTWLIVQSIRENNTPVLQEIFTKKGNFYAIEVNASFDQLCGLALEILEKSKYATLEQVKIATSKIGFKKLTGSETQLEYTSSQGDNLNVTYNTQGTFSEPLFDWGYGYTTPTHIHQSPPIEQPRWPSGKGHGKIATWSVNGKRVDLSGSWPVYEEVARP